MKKEKYNARAKQEEAYLGKLVHFDKGIDTLTMRGKILGSVQKSCSQACHPKNFDNPMPISADRFVEIVRVDGLEKATRDFQNGRYMIVAEEPVYVSFSAEQMAHIMADVFQIKDMRLRASLVDKLISNK